MECKFQDNQFIFRGLKPLNEVFEVIILKTKKVFVISLLGCVLLLISNSFFSVKLTLLLQDHG